MADSSVVYITSESFNENVLHSKQLILLDFRASWCGFCRALESIIKKIDKKYARRVISKSGLMKICKILNEYFLNIGGDYTWLGKKGLTLQFLGLKSLM